MDINIKLNSISFGRAIAKLRKYANSLEPKLSEIVRRLVELGVPVVDYRFKNAPYDGERIINVQVKKLEESSEKVSYEILANGDAVMFIEFGAGVHYPDDHPKAVKFKALHGTYGKGLGKNDWWFYTGQPGKPGAGGELAHGHKNTTITHGNPAAMPMYNTAQDLRKKVHEIAKEVLLRHD